MGKPIPWCFYCDEQFDTEEEREQHEKEFHDDSEIKYRGPDIPDV